MDIITSNSSEDVIEFQYIESAGDSIRCGQCLRLLDPNKSLFKITKESCHGDVATKAIILSCHHLFCSDCIDSTSTCPKCNVRIRTRNIDECRFRHDMAESFINVSILMNTMWKETPGLRCINANYSNDTPSGTQTQSHSTNLNLNSIPHELDELQQYKQQVVNQEEEEELDGKADVTIRDARMDNDNNNNNNNNNENNSNDGMEGKKDKNDDDDSLVLSDDYSHCLIRPSLSTTTLTAAHSYQQKQSQPLQSPLLDIHSSQLQKNENSGSSIDQYPALPSISNSINMIGETLVAGTPESSYDSYSSEHSANSANGILLSGEIYHRGSPSRGAISSPTNSNKGHSSSAASESGDANVVLDTLVPGTAISSTSTSLASSPERGYYNKALRQVIKTMH